MKAKNLDVTEIEPSPFKDLKGIEYFLFEEDFIEKNVRCIPMIVRFKMDAVGIKLKLKEWSKMDVPERIQLAKMNCEDVEEKNVYKQYLESLIIKYTGAEPTTLLIVENPAWAALEEISQQFLDKAAAINMSVNINQWRQLSNLQRFALLKLCRPGHESKNFIRAIKEFGIL